MSQSTQCLRSVVPLTMFTFHVYLFLMSLEYKIIFQCSFKSLAPWMRWLWESVIWLSSTCSNCRQIQKLFCRFQTLSNMNLVKNSIRTFLHIQTCLINPKHFNFLNLEPGRLKFDAWNILPRVLNRNGWRLFTWLATSPEPYQLWHVWPSQKLRFRLSAININKFETFKWWWYKVFNLKMGGKYLSKSSYLID